MGKLLAGAAVSNITPGMAHRRLTPPELAWGVGRVEGVMFNRRFWMWDGSVHTLIR
jgi:hypothetical protein